MVMRSIRSVRSEEPGTSFVNTVNWGAIFAGGFIALALSALFSFLAIGLEIGGFNLLRPTADTTVGEGIYSILTIMASVAAGGYVTARIGGFTNRKQAVMHALTHWAAGSGILAVAAAGFTGFYLVATAGMGWVLLLCHVGGAAATCVAAIAGCRPARAVMGPQTEIPSERPAA